MKRRQQYFLRPYFYFTGILLHKTWQRRCACQTHCRRGCHTKIVMNSMPDQHFLHDCTKVNNVKFFNSQVKCLWVQQLMATTQDFFDILNKLFPVVAVVPLCTVQAYNFFSVNTQWRHSLYTLIAEGRSFIISGDGWLCLALATMLRRPFGFPYCDWKYNNPCQLKNIHAAPKRGTQRA